MMRVLCGTAAVLVLSSACTSNGTSQPNSARTGRLSSTLSGSTFADLCQYLTRTGALFGAEVAATGHHMLHDPPLTWVKDDINQALAHAPLPMHRALSNISRDLSLLSHGGHGEITIVADSRLLVGECRTRGLAIPRL